MNQDSTMIVRLSVRQEGEMFYVTSPNVDGLNVCGQGVEATYQSVVKVVKALFKHKLGFEVEVWPATTDGKDFPNMMHLCNEVVVRRKAA